MESASNTPVGKPRRQTPKGPAINRCTENTFVRVSIAAAELSSAPAYVCSARQWRMQCVFVSSVAYACLDTCHSLPHAQRAIARREGIQAQLSSTLAADQKRAPMCAREDTCMGSACIYCGNAMPRPEDTQRDARTNILCQLTFSRKVAASTQRRLGCSSGMQRVRQSLYQYQCSVHQQQYQSWVAHAMRRVQWINTKFFKRDRMFFNSCRGFSTVLW